MFICAPIILKNKDYYWEVIVKSSKDRQGFYIHKIELKEKLSDVFSRTFQQGTSESSIFIITDLVNNFNHTINQVLFQSVYIDIFSVNWRMYVFSFIQQILFGLMQM